MRLDLSLSIPRRVVMSGGGASATSSLALLSPPSDVTPDFTYLSTLAIVGDTARLIRSRNSDLSSPENFDALITSVAPLVMDPHVTGEWLVGVWYVAMELRRAAVAIDITATITFTLTDAIAPPITAQSAVKTGSTTADVFFTISEPNGNIDLVITTSATLPTQAQIEAHTDNSNVAAAAFYELAVTSGNIGAKTVNITGLTAATTYYAHIMQVDYAGNATRVSTSSFVTDPAVWVPSLIFSGRKGGAYDWSNYSGLTNIYTDVARTTLVTTNGDLIRSVTDLSGNNNHFEEATNPPTYDTTLGYGVAKFDGTNDIMGCAITALLNTFNAAGSGTLIMALRHPSTVSDRTLVSFSVGTSTNARCAIGVSASNLLRSIARRTDADSSSINDHATSVASVNLVATAEFNWTGNLQYISKDKAAKTSIAITTAGSTSATNSQVVKVGATAVPAGWTTAYIARAIFIDTILSSTDLDKAREWCALGQGGRVI